MNHSSNAIANPSVVRVALLGAGGRMGHAILAIAHEYPDMHISAALVAAGSSLIGQVVGGLVYRADLPEALAGADVLLDFSKPTSTVAAIDACVAAHKPLVIGVTGLDAALQKKIEKASHAIAVLVAPNMSPGVNLLLQLTATAVAALGGKFDIEIMEAHHRHKLDAPSGTALALGEAIAGARGIKPEAQAAFKRGNQAGARQPHSVDFTSVRAGDIVGQHTVLLSGPGERLEFTHRAESRETFARGALQAVHWLAGKPAGRYRMTDVLGIGTYRP